MKKLFSICFLILINLSLFAEPHHLSAIGEDRHLINDFVQAINIDDVYLAQKILSEGVSVDDFNNTGITPLMMAVIRKNPEMLQLLLNNGAHPGLPVACGLTPLEFAQKSNRQAYLMLLDNFLRNQGQGFGYLTVLVIQQKLPLLKEALQLGLDPNQTEKNGTTPLMYAVHTHQPAMIQVLLEAGANPDIPDKMGNTARSLAEQMRNSEKNSDLVSLFK